MPSVLQILRLRRHSALPWTALVIVWLVWGSTFLGIRVAVQSIPPLLMSGTRYMAAGALLCAILALAQRGRRIAVSRDELRNALVTAVLLLVIGNGLLSISEVHLESGTAALLVGTVSLWMIVLDALLTKKIKLRSLAAVVLGSLGVLALTGAPSAHSSPVAAAMVLVGSFSWAAGSVYGRRYSTAHTNAFVVGIEMFVAGCIMCALGIGTGELRHVHAIPAPAIAGWLWLVFAGAMLAYSAYSYAMKTLPTNVVATYAYVNPVVAVALGSILLKEPVTPSIVLGGLAIVASVVVIVLSNRKEARQTEGLPEAA